MRTIKLSKISYGRYDDASVFPLGDLELQLEDMPTYSGEFRFVAECNGKKCHSASVTAAYSRVNIPREKLTAGLFTAEVQHYSRGILVKRFPIEPLTITDTAGVMRAAPAIGQVETLIDELAEAVDALQTRADTAETRANSAEARLQDLEARLAVLEANNDIFNA